MKIIFSRKGFDDAYGGSPSPILPDGTLLSLPIPVKKAEQGELYNSLYYKNKSYLQIIKELGVKLQVKSCHLDPDLHVNNRSRPKGWMSAFGQQGAAAKHLMNEGVEAGDLFIFFGTFKRTFLDNRSKLRFENDYPRHIIFGFLKVGELIDLSTASDKIKSKYYWHPHIQNDYGKNNLLFVASKQKGVLKKNYGIVKYNDRLVLTRDGYRKSIWELPEFFHPDKGTKISRHLKEKRFDMRGDKTIMQTVGIGQDFVVHAEDRRVANWASNLINNCT